MPSAQTSRASRTSFCHLAPGVSASDVAHDARAVALAFVNGVAAGWGKAELAAWLVGPYARVTRYATPTSAREPGELRDGSAEVQFDPEHDRTAPPLMAEDVTTLLRDARWRILAKLEGAAAARSSYANAALACGLVVRCLDDGGHHGFAPAGALNARLSDRVLALFAVDRLRNPELHRDALFVCSRCERIVVDAATRGRGVCDAHGPGSGEHGVQRRVGRVTRPYAYPALEHMGKARVS